MRKFKKAKDVFFLPVTAVRTKRSRLQAMASVTTIVRL